ncbi:TetR/AcrR family transcriptional regulator [Pseudonocardia kunmingensis]|uniref:TetR family transcriptional regulator n=1 Tax=Pseudonocardia kunmingensis TaxID=630975 RepID=A0A543DWT4_9PSEU|nr:TetR/AcrR family transcriptional regulator [Pseudonocardia kunmingensis]TQM13800.1 TetR family transcriptional regulator [Pseudonocardia kunmingensis]
MTDRRTEILDAALHVLAEHGMRGLTHRAVDAAAGIATGSTSYYFRSRSALVTGCVERLLEVDLEVESTATAAADDAAGLVDVLVAVGVALATTERHRTLARYELSLAAVRDPELRAGMVRAGDVIRARGAAALGAIGAVEPGRAAEQLMAVLDGLVLTALVRGPREPAALAAALRPTLERVVRGEPGVDRA